MTLTPDIHYEYAVNGHTYQGNTVTYGSFARPLTEDLLAAYPPGAIVDVSYDPSTPSHAVLTPGVDTAQIFLAALAYGAHMLFLALR